jgi:hypothetical protein
MRSNVVRGRNGASDAVMRLQIRGGPGENAWPASA